MSRVVLIVMLLGLIASSHAKSPSTSFAATTSYSYYPPSRDKASWQRLNLWLSSTYLYISKEAQTDQDSCLIIASRYLGLSRFALLAEGFADEKLREQSAWFDRADPNLGIRLLASTNGKRRLQTLLLLGAYYAFQPSAYTRYRDSTAYFLQAAIKESKTQKEGKWQRTALCLLGKIYLQVNDPKGDSIYHQLLLQCKQAGDKETEARAMAYRGIYTATQQATFQRKIQDLQQAADIYHSIGDIEGEINVLTDLGYLLTVIGKQSKAYDLFYKALSLEESIHYPYTHYNTEALANVTMYQGKFGEPLRYTHQTIKVAENCRDSIGWGLFYGRLAILYTSEGRQEEGYDMALKATQRFVIDRNPAVYNVLNIVVERMNNEGRANEALTFVSNISKKVNPLASVADQFFYQNMLSTCYLNLNKFDSAEIHIKKMDSLETLAEAVRGPFRRAGVNQRYAELYLKRGQFRIAKSYLEKNATIQSYGHHALMNDLWGYHLLIATDSALGNYKAVIAHYKEYTKLLDSNYRVNKIRQAEELQVMYETREKEAQLIALNQQAQQSKLVKNLTLGGIGAVAIIALLLYRQNRLKQKSNQIITLKNIQLQDLLDDKEWLLKEIHHRVKNNLQIIMSLLDSQSRYIDNSAALTAINDSQRRVQAISLIHQKLYQSENTSFIDMPRYIDELISYLQDSFDFSHRTVIEQDIEPLKLDVSKAIPLGLIINEAIVNAIKYAFPGQQQGVVKISLQHHDPDHLLLHIADNGIGLPSDMNLVKQGALGFTLMRGLTKQLDGVFNIENNQGLHISILFSTSNNLSYE
ncbi:two-component sensor histidine kinase [Chitinophaga skermanii]|uniref:histidine kinase n=1 Tax=Chitinophaga skermanii TaxID=331697 RepID=A0A327QUR5_9BACT|nr:sensor histidine kinase [Chitinophaga skermanii]RAJ08359.1 two-component sensor histidine kinase [Chitinophaga skermanii]